MPKPVAERYDEFLERASALAKELALEIEFTTHSSSCGYLAYDYLCVEVITTDTHEYLETAGRVCIPK